MVYYCKHCGEYTEGTKLGFRLTLDEDIIHNFHP